MAIRLRMSRHSAVPDRPSNLSFWLLIAFLAILWAAGGASRADVLGQPFIRFSAWSIIMVAILALPRVDWRAVKEPAIILGAAALLVALQLVPLPPTIWSQLPGRAIFTEAGILTGNEQPWRPISISPSGTTNALGSLIVPAVVLMLAANLTREQHWRIAIFILGLVAAGAVLGVLQFSGIHFDNALINTVPSAVAGNLANRNHFALSLAIGCVLALAWAFCEETRPWKAAVAFAVILIFILLILATGSRSGLILGLLAIALTFFMLRKYVSPRSMVIPRGFAGAIFTLGIAVLIGTIWLSVGLDRAFSIDRVTAAAHEADLRWQIWPVVRTMALSYSPVGTGLGTFDAAFRISEPDGILNPKYINMAHNDWLQIFLEAGLLGIGFSGATVVWLCLRSFQAWTLLTEAKTGRLLSAAGSIIITLIFIASMTDYPAHTPFMMALLALGAIWLVKETSVAGCTRKGRGVT
ncbi:hypothetical protein GRI55_00015 [Erythrobacter citreus]|uniref:O-antigen ligase n=1 Tax=Qipengyuania citrea TaxID=225971 RepID=A0A6I4U5G7_9SPHN|nr:O-antigen ligase family protein [Qipengyuania citrea]MDQ0565783.1 O-antigen ligase [Qipengyuania citrea]MXP34152.1 hypothetical protein [Qipengyuania citrea]